MKDKTLTPAGVIERFARLGERLDRHRLYRLMNNKAELTLDEAHLFKAAFELDSLEELQEPIA